jgi:hypothetical protein
VFRQFFAGMDLGVFPLFALLFFLLLFAVVGARLFLLKRPADYAHDEALPLSDDHEVKP